MTTRKGSPVTTTDNTQTTTEVPDTSAPTRHARLAAWVAEAAALTQPDAVHWVDGSQAEYDQLLSELVAAGTFVKLDKKPDSYWCASDPSDVARVEDRTFICSVDEADAGPTNNWMDPGEMRAIMTDLYCAAGRCTSSRSSWATSTPPSRCSASRSPTARTSSCPCA
jgi:GTP-dependent phosphoenolpyruvate carboxykinase